jgi:hypothetical protein
VKINNRRYTGSKYKLMPWIRDLILQNCPEHDSVFDVFGGTGVVTAELLGITSSNIINDFLFSNETIYKVNTYTFINIFSCSLSIIASILMSYQLSKRESNITAITLFTICQTFIWHSYCCLSNIILGLNYPMFILRFTLIGFGYMICFSIFDLKLLYTYWQILLRQIPYDMFMRIKFRFYLIFYALFFCSFFIPIKAFYDKVFISVNFLPLWLPQIVFNAVKNNIIGLPLMYVLINTLERTVLTIYFRGYNES